MGIFITLAVFTEYIYIFLWNGNHYHKEGFILITLKCLQAA